MTRVMVSTPVNDAKSSKSDSIRARTMPQLSRLKKSATAATKVATSRRSRLRKVSEVAKRKEDEQEQESFGLSDTVKTEQEPHESQRQEIAEEEDEKQQVASNDATDVLPAQDTQLRRNYLQRMYRQLQGTHPTQNDAKIRQLATTMEMELCQKATTRSHYIAAMEQKLHHLMEVELAQTKDVHTFDPGYQPLEMAQSRRFEYAQALAKAQEQEQPSTLTHSGPFSTASSDSSFQSLMSTPYLIAGAPPGHRLTPLPNLSQFNGDTAFYPSPSTSRPFALCHDMPSHSTPRNLMDARHHGPATQAPNSMRVQSRVATFQEFSAQIQHLDKSVLIELLWNQRSALARWQKQAKQLELQLSVHRTASSTLNSPRVATTFDSPMRPFVTPHVAAEAELVRARERNNSRMARMPSTSYGQSESASANQLPRSQNNYNENPQLYWERVRALKTAYSDKLQTALRALAHNTAPPNSVYSVKAQSMMQNIALVLNILNEQPTSLQPRKFDVLNSIERFMQMSVNPIVQKVLASADSRAPVVSTATAVARNLASHSSEEGTRASQVKVLDNSSQSNEKARDSCGSSPDTPQELDSNAVYSPPIDTPPQTMEALTPKSLEADTEFEASGFDATKAEKDLENFQSPDEATATNETRRPSLSSGDPTGDDSSTKVIEDTVDDALNEFSELVDITFEDPVDTTILAKENHSSNVAKRKIDDM